MLKTFGLTGGIGTGKSTVAQRLREKHKVPILDADQVSRQVVVPGSEGLHALVEAFGPEILDDVGALDRAKMRRRILHDEEARHTLNGIMHPRIHAYVETWRAAQDVALAGVESALIVETNSVSHYLGLVVVTAKPETQVARVMVRDRVSKEDAEAMLALQLPMSEKERYATWVIHNDGDLEALLHEVDLLWPFLRAWARSTPLPQANP